MDNKKLSEKFCDWARARDPSQWQHTASEEMSRMYAEDREWGAMTPYVGQIINRFTGEIAHFFTFKDKSCAVVDDDGKIISSDFSFKGNSLETFHDRGQ